MGDERLLRVEAPHFVAGAVWVREGAGWRCVEVAPILRWMVGKPAPEVGAYLKRKGWAYEWVSAAERGDGC